MEFKVGDIVETIGIDEYGIGIITRSYPDARRSDEQILLVQFSIGKRMLYAIDLVLYDPTRLELALNNHLNLVD